MKREEIEQLLTDYANGQIAPEDKQRLEELFEQDLSLKHEADEMTAVLQELRAFEEQPSSAMDDRFFVMLKQTKAEMAIKGAQVVQIRTSWLKTAGAVAACIAMFVIGRFTASPVYITKYQSTIAKQIKKPSQPQSEIVPVVKSVVNKPVKPKDISTNVSDPKLAQQLRSVYASERIDAVTKLSAQKNISKADLKLLETALQEDPNTNVRLTVINSLRPLIKNEGVQQVLVGGLNHQGDLMVQNTLVDLLVNSKSQLKLPQMMALLDNVLVQNKVKDGIESFPN